MIEIREITIEDAAIESTWRDEMPAWWKIVDKSVNSFSRGPITRLGVFDDELMAIYTLQEVGPKIIDAHLSCKRGVDPNVLIESAKVVKHKLLNEGYTTIFLWPLRQNFGLIKIARKCGFKPTGVKMLQGQMGNRPAEWIQLGVSNEH